MIDYLTFIEELSVVEKLLENKESGDPVFNIIIAKGKIRELKRKYEKRVSDFESNTAPKADLSMHLETTTELLNQNDFFRKKGVIGNAA